MEEEGLDETFGSEKGEAYQRESSHTMSSYFRQQLEHYLSDIDVSGRVLDVGGSQKGLKGRTKSWSPTEYRILDIEDRGEEVDYVYDIQKDSDLSLHKGEVFFGKHAVKQFDMVFCLEVMEYLIEPSKAIRNMAKFCRMGGKFVISFPFVYPLHPPSGKDFLRYTKYGAVELLQRNHFKIIQYLPRYFSGRNLWLALLDHDGFRYDKSEGDNALNECGCVIVAERV